MSMDDKRRARQMTKEGVEAARAGNLQAALPRLQQAVQLDREYPEGWYWLGRYLDDPQQQIVCMQRALQLRPDYDKAQQALEVLQQSYQPEPEPTPEDDDLFLMDDQDADDPFADLRMEAEQPASSSSSGTGSRLSVIGGRLSDPLGGQVNVDEIRDGLTEQFTGENRRALLRAWWAALVYDHHNSYEAFRGRMNPIISGLTMAITLAAMPIVVVLVAVIALVIDSGGGIEIGELFEFIFRGLIGGVLLAIQTVVALYAASFVSSTIAHNQYNSEATTGQHFSMTSLFIVPLTLLIGFFAILSIIFGLLFSTSSNILFAISTTTFALLIFFVSQYVFSNIAIHKLNFWRGILVSFATILAFSVAWAWLLPITSPLLGDVFGPFLGAGF